MSLEEKFESDISAWKDHCEQVKHSSNPNDYTNCDAYRNIVALGKKALPLIQRIAGTTELFISMAVQEIAGEEFRIPEQYAGKLTEVEAYTKGWLDGKYPKIHTQKFEVRFYELP